MRIVSVQLDGRGLDLLIDAVQFAISNLHELNEAIDGDIQESELETLKEKLEAKK